jgi:hypothetical protein
MSGGNGERDDAADTSLHDRLNLLGRAVRNGANGVICQMRVPLGGAGLAVPEHLADEIEAVAARHGNRGEAVPKVMNADIAEPGRTPDALPGLLNADEMSVTALGGQNVWAALLSRQLGKRAKRGCPKQNGFCAGLAVGQYQAAALEIDPLPPKRQDLRQTASGKHQ